MDEGLAWNHAEEMDEVFGSVADVVADGVSGGGGIENGEIDVGVGVGRVEEGAEADGFLGLPELVNPVHVHQMVQEAAMLVPALAGPHRPEKRYEGRQLWVDGFKLTPEEGTSRG